MVRKEELVRTEFSSAFHAASWKKTSSSELHVRQEIILIAKIAPYEVWNQFSDGTNRGVGDENNIMWFLKR